MTFPLVVNTPVVTVNVFGVGVVCTRYVSGTAVPEVKFNTTQLPPAVKPWFANVTVHTVVPGML